VFGDTVVLWRVSRHHFMPNAAVLKKLLDVPCCVLPPTIGVEGFDFEPHLQFGPCDKCFEVLSDLRLLFER
jgi:hypothetical protein